MKYLIGVYCAGGIMAALGLALAGAASTIATGIAVALVMLAAGAALALCLHVAGVARVAVERARWDGRRALVEAQQATIPYRPARDSRSLPAASITVDAVVLTPERNRIYN